MKKITCLDCDQEFSGETPEATMKNMMPHYEEKHKDIMEAGTEEKRKLWMAEFQRRWDAAVDIAT